MELTKRDVVLEVIRRELTPVGAVWMGHPLLLRAASRSILGSLPLKLIQQWCRQLNTNVDGLMELLEKQEII